MTLAGDNIVLMIFFFIRFAIKIRLINTLMQVKEMINTVENKQIDLYLNASQSFRHYVGSYVLSIKLKYLKMET